MSRGTGYWRSRVCPDRFEIREMPTPRLQWISLDARADTSEMHGRRSALHAFLHAMLDPISIFAFRLAIYTISYIRDSDATPNLSRCIPALLTCQCSRWHLHPAPSRSPPAGPSRPCPSRARSPLPIAASPRAVLRAVRVASPARSRTSPSASRRGCPRRRSRSASSGSAPGSPGFHRSGGTGT